MGVPRKSESRTASPESEVSVKSGATSPSTTKRSSQRAVGVVRVSEVGDRDTLTLDDQRKRIEDWCGSEGHNLVAVFEERNVSGGDPLTKRTGLRPAVEMVEAEAASILVVAYFDRLVRSLQVQAEVTARVEKAGGRVFALDVGEVSTATAAQWMASTQLGAAAEYLRRTTAERTMDAKRRAIEQGVPTFSKIPPGYRRVLDDGKTIGVEFDPVTADVVREAWAMRADGGTIRECREYLREHGVERSFHGVQAMFESRFYLGELHFGELQNLHSHEPLIDRVTWQRVQRVRVPRGPRPSSDRLLARLDVLRCGTCGSRMVVGTSHDNQYPVYRCPPVGDCPRRVTVSASLVEAAVVEAVGELLEGVAGKASPKQDVAAAQQVLDARQADLDKGIRNLAGLEDEPAAREQLTELREERDAARERVVELEAASGPVFTITAGGNWDDLSREAQRALIRAVIDRVEIAPGRGPERITVHPRI